MQAVDISSFFVLDQNNEICSQILIFKPFYDNNKLWNNSNNSKKKNPNKQYIS